MITAERIAVLTGAGISTASGIPDFRGKPLIILNADPTPYDDQASELHHTPIETTLPKLFT